MPNPAQFQTKLYENLAILQEREAKYGGHAPLELLNQVADHRQAIELTGQVITGELSEAAWQEALLPLLLPFYQGLSQSVLAALLETTSSSPEAPVSRLREAVLGHLEQTARGQVLAEGFRHDPAIYDKPVAHELTLSLPGEAEWAVRLHRLLAEVEAGAGAGGDQATLSGSGAIAQGGGPAVAATGPGSIAIGAVGEDVTIGSGNVSIKGSRVKAGERAVIGSRAGGDLITGSDNTVINPGGDYVGGDKIRMGNVSNAAVAVGPGAQATLNQGVSGEAVAEFFATLYRQIDSQPGLSAADKEDAKAELAELEAAAKAEPDGLADSFLKRRLRHLERIAPDIIDVILATLANPAVGLGVVGAKIKAKAMEISAARV